LTKGKQVADTSSDDDDEPASSRHPAATPTPVPLTEEPWKREFNHHLKGEDELPEKVSLVQWWGVHVILFNHVASAEFTSER
jgi:hypothetical protein